MSLYELDGSQRGRPVVVIHGALGAPAQWDEVSARIAGRRIARAWLPGHGRSPWYPSDESFVGCVDQLAAATPFDRPALLVGYSMGARVALAIAVRYPERVTAAVLIGVHAGLDDDDERAARVAWDDAQARAVLSRGVAAFVSSWESLPLFETQRALPADTLARQRRQRLSHDARGIAWAMTHLGLGRMPSLWNALPMCRVPLFLVAGERDAKFSALARRIAETAAHASVTIAAGVGHNVVLEAPEAVARAAVAAESDPSAVAIRRAAIEDAAGIARVHVSSWQDAYEGIVPEAHLRSLNVEQRAERWREILATAKSESLVAESDDGTIVGFASVGAGRDEDLGRAGEVLALYVAPDRWGSLAGWRLLGAAEQRMRERGHDEAFLWVLCDNARARRFYERSGWRSERERTIAIGGAALPEVRYRYCL